MSSKAAQGQDIAADVVIIGGGLVGGPLALALAVAGISTAVIDHADPQALLQAGFDGRASSVALASQRVLAGIGLWDSLAADATPILDIRVAEGASPLILHYDHAEVGTEALGYMLENRLMRRALIAGFDWAAAARPDSVRYLAPAVVAGLERRETGVTATLTDGRRVHAQLCVAADGRASATREAAGIAVTRWDYRQTGIVCTVAHERPHDNVAHEHFRVAGPFAILPLTGNRSSIVWTEKSALADTIMGLEDDEFFTELSRRFGDFLGPIEITGPKWAYPLSLQFAHQTTAHRLALIGDAAHAQHPIAGQGMNMGLRDVAALAEVLADVKRLGGDLGTADVLARYARWRRFDNTLMMAVTDGLNRLFSNDIEPLRLARDIGLAVVNVLPPVKRRLMRHAMGLAGDLPRLMKGEAL